jgi:hypothetical protein
MLEAWFAGAEFESSAAVIGMRLAARMSDVITACFANGQDLAGAAMSSICLVVCIYVLCCFVVFGDQALIGHGSVAPSSRLSRGGTNEIICRSRPFVKPLAILCTRAAKLFSPPALNPSNCQSTAKASLVRWMGDRVRTILIGEGSAGAASTFITRRLRFSFMR